MTYGKPAKEYGYEPEDYKKIIPGGGWRVAWFDPDTGELFARQIVCWALTFEGSLVPVSVDRAGWVDRVDKDDNFLGILEPGEIISIASSWIEKDESSGKWKLKSYEKLAQEEKKGK
jgi:hypothetical protein